MRFTLIRILKHGLPAAAMLALIGFLMGELAGMFVAGNTRPRVGVDPDARAAAVEPDGRQVAQVLRIRLPILMAACGLSVVATFELLNWFWRGQAAPPKPTLAVPSERETEMLLNELLRRAEADRAAKAQAMIDTSMMTPPPVDLTHCDDAVELAAPCPESAATDNSPVPVPHDATAHRA
ncbi:hypothetical protein [Fimbriiglobus ruber]|uniref:Uncharacterized protein n=1 Tax=Fimbriiglobus ruber TaxID=1908690 RepID=A0A225D9C7_9BACT|nr:hypothetical protein [Fimbriiglobus ruber]OWK36264.1 hypothetical protein FRUB_08827 [Fimbriiglobus ruber]